MLYERLDVWRRARQLSIDTYLEMRGCKDFGFKDQITRSALSIPSNIAEGCERSSATERRRFFDYAKGSAGEYRTQLDIGMAVGYISRTFGDPRMREISEIAKMLAALMKSLSH